MAKKTKSYMSVWMLMATVMLSGGWLMKPVPVLMFGALAPLMAISEQAKPGLFWERLEYILLAFLFSFWAAHLFELAFVLPAIGQAIISTLVFGAVTFARPTLGRSAAAFLLLASWLALEFLLVKTGFAQNALFLADAFSGRANWTGWTPQAGYLAGSAWVLLANFALYRACWGESPVQPGWLVFFLMVVITPIGYSLFHNLEGVTREQMLLLYSGSPAIPDAEYARGGEVVARTCAWVAVLVILFVLVKGKINRK